MLKNLSFSDENQTFVVISRDIVQSSSPDVIWYDMILITRDMAYRGINITRDMI